MRVEHHDRVDGRESRLRQIGATAGRIGDRRCLRLGLVVGDDRRTTGIADEDHVLVTGAHEMPHHGADVEQAVLEDQRGVVADIARGETDRAEAALGEAG